MKLPYGKQDLDKTYLEAVVKVLESDYLTIALMAPKFGNKIKDVTGSKFAIAWHLYSGCFDFERLKLNINHVIRELRKTGLYTQLRYIPVRCQQYHKKLHGEKIFPGSEEYFEKTLSLPLITKMKKSDVLFIINQPRKILL